MRKLRRFIWYLAGRLLLITVLLGLFTVTFYYAMNASNIYIVLKDGMAKRAQVIMMGESPSDLTKFFQGSYLQRDENLLLAIDGRSPYSYYTIRGIDHRLEMTWMWCWPWESTARVEFIETIPRIDGRVNGDYAEAARALYGEGYESPPKWQGGRYHGHHGQGKQPVAHSQPVAGGTAGWGRRGRPAMSESMTVHIIARIRSDFGAKFGIPRQSGLVDSLTARVIFEPEYRNSDVLRGLDGFSHLWLIWQFSQCMGRDWSPTVRPPKLAATGAWAFLPRDRRFGPILSACPPCGWSESKRTPCWGPFCTYAAPT